MSVEVSVHGELNDFLPAKRRSRRIAVDIAPGTTVKDLAESLGVPHTEIDVITVNGESVGFHRQVGDGDRVSVYPTRHAVGAAPIISLRPPPMREPRFVLDVHLGRLARYLRLLGFDSVWHNDASDDELVDASLHEQRTLLTRDRGLLKRRAVTHGCFVRETAPRAQVVEVLRRLDLFGAIAPFDRCLDCNGLLKTVAKAEIEDRLLPRTRRDHDVFQQCRTCGRVYWRGSHYDRMRVIVEDIRNDNGTAAQPRSRQSSASAALAASERGWSVVPMHTPTHGRCSCGDPSCAAPGKHPRVAWDRLTRSAATRAEVAQWWQRWPEANLGVVTGAVSGLVVLDVDPRHGGGDALTALEAVHGLLPTSVESLTGGGGQHLYFTHPDVRVPSRAVASGLEIKGEGAIVVAPPSVHLTGRTYVWECEPGDIELADLPAWLLALALDPPRQVSSVRRSVREAPMRTEAERRLFAELWAEVGVHVRPGDHNYLCPFHDDHHPSLHIDAEGCRFYCFGCARGGGDGRLRRLVGLNHGVRAAGRVISTEPMPSPADVTLSGDTEIEVVGESKYQDALLELTGGRRHYAGVRLHTAARLLPEPENAADPNAIAVTVGGQRVGYLSRADAERYRDAISAAIQRSGQASCSATIVGGWEREHGDIGYFGVRLRL
jgi:uncharacterized protein